MEPIQVLQGQWIGGFCIRSLYVRYSRPDYVFYWDVAERTILDSGPLHGADMARAVDRIEAFVGEAVCVAIRQGSEL